MNRRCLSVLTAILAAAVAVPFAGAQQTPAQVLIGMGTGQLVCTSGFAANTTCINPPPSFPQAVYAIVVDANGNPIPNYPVTWNVVSGPATLSGQASISSNTDTTGSTFVTPTFAFSAPLGNTPFASSTFTATAGSITGTFIVTTAYAAGFGSVGTAVSQVLVGVDFQCLNTPTGCTPVPLGGTLSGTSGSTTTPFNVRVYSLQTGPNGGTGVPGVSVRLINDDGTSGPSTQIPSAYCQTGSGADPWSVVTDANGNATCTPVFGPVGGNLHQVAVLVGGLPAGIWSPPGTAPGTLYNPASIVYNPGQIGVQPLPGFAQTQFINLNVKAAVIGSVTATSGSGQTANPGQALPNPLVVTVKDSSGNPLAGQPVSWTVTPSTAGTLTNQIGITNTSGQASANLTFSSTASGNVTVTATVSGRSANFAETAIPPVSISSLTKVSGDGQSAVISQPFATPLAVQVAVNSGSVANVPVTWSVQPAGMVTLSATSTVTNSSGIAQVTVTAGSTPGNVTVTAGAGSLSQVFTLVVNTPVVFTASNFVNGADQQKGSIAPCGLATIAASGVAPAVAGTLSAPLVGPLPLTLGGVTIAFNSNDYAPIVSVSANAVTFLLPCDVTAGSAVPVTVNASGSTGTVNVPVLAAAPGIFSTVQSDGVSRAVIVRPDGTFASPQNPARRGEYVTAFVTGLGAVSPSVATNTLPIPGTPSTANGQVIVGVNNGGTVVQSAQLSQDRQGVYTITFQIPQNAPQANNVVFSVAVIAPGAASPAYSAGSQIPVQ